MNTSQQTLVSISLRLRQIANELENYSKAGIWPQTLSEPDSISSTQEPGVAAGSAPVPKPDCNSQPALNRDDHLGAAGHISYTVKIPSSLASRLGAFFDANVKVKRRDFYENAIRHQLSRCENRQGEALIQVLRFNESRERIPRQFFVNSELDLQLQAFKARHKSSWVRLICSALERELEACDGLLKPSFCG
jgi:hypothetical protein